MRKNWVVIGAGVAILLLILFGSLVAFGVWFWFQQVQTSTADRSRADDRFASARRPFAGQTPFITLDDRQHGRLHCDPRAEPGSLRSLHVLAYNDEGRLIEAEVPYWLARLKSVPIQAGSSRMLDENSRFTVQDLERCGAGLVLDAAPRDGGRVLVWQR